MQGIGIFVYKLSGFYDDAAGILEDYEAVCGKGRNPEGYYSAYDSPFLRGTFGGKWSGFAFCAGNAWTFRHFYDTDIYETRCCPIEGGL